MRYFEDFAVGEVFDLGSVQVSRDEVVEFARRYDPQPFHVDEAAAAGTSFGGLIASGWHTASLCMRLYVDALLGDAASMGSPGVDSVRWTAPVRPGDTITLTMTVLDARPSATAAGRGTVTFDWEAVQQDGVTVLRMTGRGLFARRP